MHASLSPLRAILDDACVAMTQAWRVCYISLTMRRALYAVPVRTPERRSGRWSRAAVRAAGRAGRYAPERAGAPGTPRPERSGG